MNGKLAVVSQSGQSLSFFDLESGKRVKHLTDLIAEPHELCLDAKRGLLYMSHTYRHGHFWEHGEQSHEISVVDCSKMEIVDTIETSPYVSPHGLALNAVEDVLYASVERITEGDNGGIIGIDLKSRKVVKKVESQGKSHWFAMTPDGKKAYTCNKTAHFISVLDLENEKMTSKIEVPGCEEPAASLDGRFVYFPTPGAQFGSNPPNAKIEIIDTTQDKVVSEIKLAYGPQTVHVTSKGEILVGHYQYPDDVNVFERKGLLQLYDSSMEKLLGEEDIGVPLTIKSSPDGKLGFVANIFEGTVSVVDLTTMTTLKKLVVDTERRPDKAGHQGAHGMAYFV